MHNIVSQLHCAETTRNLAVAVRSCSSSHKSF